MKWLKIAIVAVVVILVLNALGLLNPSFSKKVDKASQYAKDKVISNWKDSPLSDAIDSKLVDKVVNSTTPVTFKSDGKGSYSLSGNELTGTFNSNSPRYVELSFDPTNTTSLKQAEGVISLFTGKEFHFVPSQVKNYSTVKIKISKVNNEYKAESSIGEIKIN